MCNDYEALVKFAEYREMMRSLELEMPSHQSELDLPQADDVRIGDTNAVVRLVEDRTVELVPMKFGFPPTGKGGPSSTSGQKAAISKTASAA